MHTSCYPVLDLLCVTMQFFSAMQFWYAHQLAIKEDQIFAVSASGNIPVWDAKSGQHLYSIDTFPGPEKGIQIAGNDVIISSPLEVAIYREANCKKLDLVDLSTLGLDYLNGGKYVEIESEDDYSIQFVYRNLVGVQMIQNVLVICYTVNDVNRESCLVQLAFLPMNKNQGVYVPVEHRFCNRV